MPRIALPASCRASRSGRIEYVEFLAACLHRATYLDRDKLIQAFRRCVRASHTLCLAHRRPSLSPRAPSLTDEYSAGECITHDSLKAVLGTDYDPALVADMLREGDYDGDGVINLQDYQRLMCESPPLEEDVSEAKTAVLALSQSDGHTQPLPSVARSRAAGAGSPASPGHSAAPLPAPLPLLAPAVTAAAADAPPDAGRAEARTDVRGSGLDTLDAAALGAAAVAALVSHPATAHPGAGSPGAGSPGTRSGGHRSGGHRSGGGSGASAVTGAHSRGLAVAGAEIAGSNASQPPSAAPAASAMPLAPLDVLSQAQQQHQQQQHAQQAQQAQQPSPPAGTARAFAAASRGRAHAGVAGTSGTTFSASARHLLAAESALVSSIVAQAPMAENAWWRRGAGACAPLSRPATVALCCVIADRAPPRAQRPHPPRPPRAPRPPQPMPARRTGRRRRAHTGGIRLRTRTRNARNGSETCRS